MKIESHPCFILHHRPYRETSMLLEIFSRGHGRVTLVAKGAKGGRKGWAALLQPAQRLNLSWSIRGELGTLTDIERGEGRFGFPAQNLLAVFYINELLMRLLHKDESHSELFDAYDQALARLSDNITQQATLRVFEKHLLEALGYGMLLTHEADTGNVVNADADYYYELEQGPVSGEPGTGDYLRISGQTLMALDMEDFNALENMAEAKMLMRFVLQSHLGNKPLASRELYKAYLQNTGDA